MAYCIAKHGENFMLLYWNIYPIEEAVWWTAVLTEIPVIGVAYVLTGKPRKVNRICVIMKIN